MLTHGVVTFVDEEDLLELSNYRWQLTEKGRGKRYVMTHKDGKVILMHRHIKRARDNEEVDHINSNGLDNRKRNLRFVTRSQNMQNAKKRKNCSSRYKGVDWDKRKKKWRARIWVELRKDTHIGYFTSEIDAAKAYDEKAREFYRDYARLNFPVENEPDRLQPTLCEV